MKRPVILIILILFSFLLFACENGEDTSAAESESAAKTEETVSETESEVPDTDAESDDPSLENKPTEYPEIIEAQTGYPKKEALSSVDLRKTVVDYMHEMASVTWTCEEELNFSHMSPDLIYKKGTTYLGMSYNWGVVSNLGALLDAEINALDQKTALPGNTCSSAILQAWKKVSLNVNYSYTIDMMPGVKNNGVVAVGDIPWENYNGDASTKGNTKNSVLLSIPKQQVFEAYALTMPGDAVMRQLENGGHAYMVTGETKVVRNTKGEIDPVNSYLILTDQNSVFNYAREYPSNWGYDVHYSFAYIYNEGYLPVTIPELRDNTTEKPYFTCKPNTSTSCVGYGLMRGSVESNYDITKFTMTVYEDCECGSVLKKLTLHPYEKSVDAGKATMKLGYTSLPKGSYILEIKAGNEMTEETVMILRFKV